MSEEENDSDLDDSTHHYDQIILPMGASYRYRETTN